jgi:hypothetical protein
MTACVVQLANRRGLWGREKPEKPRHCVPGIAQRVGSMRWPCRLRNQERLSPRLRNQASRRMLGMLELVIQGERVSLMDHV